MRMIFTAALLFLSPIFGDLEEYLKKIEHDPLKEKPLEQIDYVYLINLDQRPEKFQKTLSKFVPYGIKPSRFPGIYGWDLSLEAINNIGLKFKEGMFQDRWVWRYDDQNEWEPELDFLRPDLLGKTVYSFNMNLGAIGCTLSHLSVLQNAYDAGFKTIWILEDDVTITQDPHKLSTLIVKLDNLLGKEGWDVLYTDTDSIDACWYDKENNLESDLKGDLHFIWRPDSNPSDFQRLRKRTILSEDFLQIGSRMHTHSMIIRRSGMKKILDFEKKHSPFCPYDNELAFVPDLKCVNLRYDVVTAPPAFSDTRVDQFSKRAKWKAYVEESLKFTANIPGWRSLEKAQTIMNFMEEHRPKIVVEIGAFGGFLTYPIAKALAFQKSGKVYAIDAWDLSEACRGLVHQREIEWWKEVRFEDIRQSFLNLLDTQQMNEYCFPIAKPSRETVQIFEDGSIDILIIDGNASSEGSLEDVTLYLPKVKEGGYIWLTEANLDTKQPAVEKLLKNCEWKKEKSLGSRFALFQKSSRSKERL